MKNKISENFTLNELTKSQTALRYEIDNTPDIVQYKNLVALTENVLQPLRHKVGPIIVTSGFRSKQLNTKIKGSVTSQHCKGEAVDIESIKLSTYDLAKEIETYFDYDQLILEFYNQGDKHSGWVHVSFSRRNNRKQSLTAVKQDGKTVYLKGLHA